MIDQGIEDGALAGGAGQVRARLVHPVGAGVAQIGTGGERLVARPGQDRRPHLAVGGEFGQHLEEVGVELG